MDFHFSPVYSIFSNFNSPTNRRVRVTCDHEERRCALGSSFHAGTDAYITSRMEALVSNLLLVFQAIQHQPCIVVYTNCRQNNRHVNDYSYEIDDRHESDHFCWLDNRLGLDNLYGQHEQTMAIRLEDASSDRLISDPEIVLTLFRSGVAGWNCELPVCRSNSVDLFSWDYASSLGTITDCNILELMLRPHSRISTATNRLENIFSKDKV